jgi:hypothetical protein
VAISAPPDRKGPAGNFWVNMPNHRDPYIDWNKWRPKIGVIPDLHLAREIGCSRSRITGYRKDHGMPAARSKNAMRGWNAKEIKLLGTDTDEAIAEKLNRAVVTVARKRRLLGIPPMFPEADNRKPRDLEAEPEIVAAVRRAKRCGLPDDQVAFIFGSLVNWKTE